jgi:hypothetical protein
MASKELAIYLNDHLAGSAAGRDLAEKIRAQNEGEPFGAVMEQIVRDIEEDRQTLAGLMEWLGVKPSRVKLAAGSVLEKMSRLAFARGIRSDPELSRLLELEMLSLGVEGKLALWRTLKTLGAAGEELPATELDRLIERAMQQRERIEQHRLEAARKALAGGPVGASGS